MKTKINTQRYKMNLTNAQILTPNPTTAQLQIPKGTLAADNNTETRTLSENERKLQSITEKLAQGKPLWVGQDGQIIEDANASGINTNAITPIPPGKLAVQQWYEKDPQLYQDEIAAMKLKFPNFQLTKLGGGDDRLAWHGTLHIGLLGSAWKIMAVYDNDHPKKVMGTSVKTFLIDPSIDFVAEKIGQHPPHVLSSEDGYYLCIFRSEDVRADTRVTSAAQCLATAAKWILGIELVMLGKLSLDKFGGHI
ncbi:MAG: hypothetical protein LBQ66_12620 [Planctomycetaceae bacterium]|jgi:hypothetical protein|nr:hypothetical protein [Planctomycetaceae bacterium]